MAEPSQYQLERELLKLRKPLEAWRNNGEKGVRRVPEEIWESATVLGIRYGVSAICTPLGLKHSTLRAKIEKRLSAKSVQSQVSTSLTAGAPRFVELFGSPNSPSSLGPCVLLVESHKGSRLRVELDGLDAPGLALMLREFA